jgi:hypothetical protein
MLVYALSHEGKPLMPTKRCNKVAYLLKTNQAKVVKRTPFTIQLTYKTTEYVQPITLGVDAGSKFIGLSASTVTEELYSSEVKLRTDVVDKISTKREFRRARRHRKTRYRKPRFNNRKRPQGWLPPSVQQKINTHLRAVNDVHKILPITEIIVETASFDIQKIKNPDISGEDYHKGEQLGFWNVREYVLFRDGHKCQHCNGKSKDKILNVHHIESRKTGGNAPNNLITLCETCHNEHHQGKITVDIKRGKSFRDTAFMGIMRPTFLAKLQEIYSAVSETFGYITKHTRISNNLTQSKHIDALCVANHPTAKQLPYVYQQRAVRTKNRQIHKATTNKGGTRKLNQQPKYVFGFQLFDKVLWNNIQCFVSARRKSGSFRVVDIYGNQLTKGGVTYKKLTPVEPRKTLLCSVEYK